VSTLSLDSAVYTALFVARAITIVLYLLVTVVASIFMVALVITAVGELVIAYICLPCALL